MTAAHAAQPKRRDAARTRQLLLDAARRRFARDGYAATGLRDIADDAGVNVALIGRYFESKEGLFGHCLTAAADELRQDTGDVPLGRIADAVASEIAGSSQRLSRILPLLLRSSGDEGAERIRLGVLRNYGERLAAAAGWRPEDQDADQLVLRAQLVLGASTGIMLLRLSGLEPLAEAGERDLAGPLHEMIDALLAPPRLSG